MLFVLASSGRAEHAELELQASRQRGGHGIGFLDLDALQVGNGQKDIRREVRIDRGLKSDLDLLHGKTARASCRRASEIRVIARRAGARPVRGASRAIEDHADVGVHEAAAGRPLGLARLRWRRRSGKDAVELLGKVVAVSRNGHGVDGARLSEQRRQGRAWGKEGCDHGISSSESGHSHFTARRALRAQQFPMHGRAPAPRTAARREESSSGRARGARWAARAAR